MGGGDWHPITRHVLPNVFPIRSRNAILMIALAVRRRPPCRPWARPDQRDPWGGQIDDSFSAGAVRGMVVVAVPPGVAIMLVTLSFTMVGLRSMRSEPAAPRCDDGPPDQEAVVGAEAALPEMGWVWIAFGVMLAGAGALAARWTRSRERRADDVVPAGGSRALPVESVPRHDGLPFHGSGSDSGRRRRTWCGTEQRWSVRAFDLITETSEGPDRCDDAAVHVRFGEASLRITRLEIRPREVPDANKAAGSCVRRSVMELAPFNHRFRVRCDDRRFAVAVCDQRMMEAMLTLPPGARSSVTRTRCCCGRKA